VIVNTAGLKQSFAIAAALALLPALVGCSDVPRTLVGKSIDGQVLDADSSLPIAGAHVYYLYEATVIPTSFSGHNSPDVCYHASAAVTDAQGRFHIDAWEQPQKYNVGNAEPTGWAYAVGYVPAENPPKSGVYGEPMDRPNDVYRLKRTHASGDARLEELWRFVKWGCLHGGDSQRSIYPALKAGYDEAKTVAATIAERQRLDSFRYRAASAYVAPDPVSNGGYWTEKLQEFVNENLK